MNAVITVFSEFMSVCTKNILENREKNNLFNDKKLIRARLQQQADID